MSLTRSRLHGGASGQTPSSTPSLCAASQMPWMEPRMIWHHDLPAVDQDVLVAEDAAEDGGDVDDMGDPFSDDED